MECAWSITFFSIHKYNAGGNDYWRQEEMFFLMFLMRGKMKLGAAGSLMGDEHRGHLSHSLWHFSHLTCWNNHSLIHILHPAPLLRCFSVIFQISTSSLFDLLMETSNFARCRFSFACLCSALAFSLKLSELNLNRRLRWCHRILISKIRQQKKSRDRKILSSVDALVVYCMFKGALHFFYT